MKLTDLLSMDSGDILRLERTNPKELRRITSRLASAARKRVQRVGEAGFVPPAVQQLQRSGGIQSIRGRDLQQVKKEFQKLRLFLRDEQSTVKGAREFAQETARNLGMEDLTPAQLGRVLEVWGRVKERYGDVLGNAMHYDKTLDFIRDEVKAGETDLDTLLDKASERITELYEETETGGGVSGFFDLQGGAGT